MLRDEARVGEAAKGGTGYSGSGGALPANDGCWTVNGGGDWLSKWEEEGYTPGVFAKSGEVVWNQQVVDRCQNKECVSYWKCGRWARSWLEEIRASYGM